MPPSPEFARLAAEYVAADPPVFDGQRVPRWQSTHSTFLVGLRRQMYAATNGADSMTADVGDWRVTATVTPQDGGGFRFNVSVEPLTPAPGGA